MRWTSRVLHSSTPYLSLSFGPSISLHFISCVEFLLPLGPSLARRIIPFSSFAGDCLSLIIIILINYLLPLSVQSIYSVLHMYKYKYYGNRPLCCLGLSASSTGLKPLHSYIRSLSTFYLSFRSHRYAHFQIFSLFRMAC